MTKGLIMNNKGFTITEIVLIIIIAAILAAAAVPQLGRYWAGIKVGNAAMKIASDIRYAQNRATTTQQRSQISFAATNYTINSCAVADYTSGTCTCAGAGWTNVKTIDISQDFSAVTIAAMPGNCMEFDSLGRPYYNAGCANPSVSCTISSGQTFNVQYSGSIKTIDIQVQTGMISVN